MGVFRKTQITRYEDLYLLGILCGTLLGLQQTAHAQNGWPKTTTAANGSVIKLYEWQPESFPIIN